MKKIGCIFRKPHLAHRMMAQSSSGSSLFSGVKILILSLLLAFSTSPAEAGKVRLWTYAQLEQEADVVAIVLAEKIDLSDQPLANHPQSKLFQGYLATFRVLDVLKGEEKAENISFPFYDQIANFNVGTESFARLSAGKQYLVFLKKTAAGYRPVSGDLNADKSIKELKSTSNPPDNS